MRFDSKASMKHISQFVSYHQIDLDDVLHPMSHYKTFNEFFARKLKPGARPLCSPDAVPCILIQTIAVCPCDARILVYRGVEDATDMWVKGEHFTVESLLSGTHASIFQGGSMCISRLAAEGLGGLR